VLAATQTYDVFESPSTVKRDLKRARLSIVFAVLGLSDGGAHAYLPSANHDPDGDSNGTKITVTRP